jgi:hypothetical protein
VDRPAAVKAAVRARLALVLALVAGPGLGAPPDAPAQADPFVGLFAGDGLTLELSGGGGQYAGVILFGSGRYPARASRKGNRLAGEFESGAHRFRFEAVLEGRALTFTTDGATYVLRRQAQAAPGPGAAPPAPRAPGLATAFRSVPHRAGSGEILVAKVPGARSAQTLLRQALVSLGDAFGQPPRNLGGLVDREDRVAEVAFGVMRQGVPVGGMLLARVRDGQGHVAAVSDRADRVRGSIPALLDAVGVEGHLPDEGPRPAARPAVRWQDVSLPDGSGTMRLPEGFRIVGAQQGAVDVQGPEGELVSLGVSLTVVTPEGSMGAFGPMSFPFVARPSDPPSAVREIMPQLDRFLRQVNPAQPAIRLTGIREYHPIEWPGYRAGFLLVDVQLGSPQGVHDYVAFMLVAVGQLVSTQWQYYTSSVAAPREVFPRRFGDLLQVWTSWRVADHVLRQRIQQATATMREASRLLQEAHRTQQDAFDRVLDRWSGQNRGTQRWRNTATGEVEERPAYVDVLMPKHDPRLGTFWGKVDATKLAEAENQALGFQKWKPVLPGG